MMPPGKMSSAELETVKGVPKHREFILEAVRLKSFVRWPSNLSQRPEDLSAAGLFYLGHSDLVRCFFCSVSLKNWEPNDEPWAEHAYWKPSCGFVLQRRGETFVATIGKLRQQMKSIMVKIALDMGFRKELIQRTIEKKIDMTGRGYSDVVQLMDGLFASSECTGEKSMQFTPLPHFPVTPEQEGCCQDEQSTSKSKRKRRRKNQRTITGTGSKDTMRRSPSPEPEEGTPLPEEEEAEMLLEENRQIREQNLCTVCMDSEVNTVFLPCGHLVCCSTCTPALHKCPICRVYIRGTVYTYFV